MAVLYLFLACLALVTVFGGAEVPWTDDDEDSLSSGLVLDELDFDDACKTTVIPYEWDKVIGTGEHLNVDVLENFAQIQRERAFANIGHTKDEWKFRTEEVARKLELVSTPGDIILPKEKYTKLLQFAGDVSETITKRRAACEQASTPISCELTSSDPGQLLATWNTLAVVTARSDDLRVRYPAILELATEAAEANGSPNVESYWLTLSELGEDGYRKAQSLWEEVRPLYQNLHRWVVKSLQAKYGPDAFQENNKTSPDTRIPSHLLGTRLGRDWTSVADLVLTKNCKEVYDHIKLSLADNKMSGKLLYQKAEKMTGFLNVGKLSNEFWKDSIFEQTCPAKLVEPCRADPRVSACNQTTWSNYLDAHAITMRATQSQLVSSTELGYLLINGNRYSAVDSAVAGLATLIASNRHYLSQQGVLTQPKNACVKEALLTLVAMRELPKLPYYLVADLARLEAIRTNRTADIGKIWRQFKYDNGMQGLSTPEDEWWGFLEDPHIASNRPYIAHFYGVFLQFHLFQEMLMKDEGTTEDAEQFIHSREEFKSLLELGITKQWPQLVEDTFHISEVTSAPLLQFFAGLDKLVAPSPRSPASSHTSPASSRTSPAVVPTPITQVQVDTNKNNMPVANNGTASNGTASNGTASKGTASNGTSELGASAAGDTEDTGVDTVTYVLIGCGVVLTVALVAFLANYGRRKFQKNREYQRPTNQPA